MGGWLGVSKGGRCNWVLKRLGTGVTWWNFAWVVTGCMLRTVHGGFLGKFWDGPKLGDVECYLVDKCQTDLSLVIWTGPRSKIPNGCELWAPHRDFLSQIWDGTKLGDVVCFLVGNCQMDPGLAIWTGPRSEIPNGSEVGTPNWVCVGNFWSDPGSVMWWDV